MDHPITISIDVNGNLTVSPSALHVASGTDNVYYQCEYTFAIEFNDDTPLDNMSMQAQRGLTTGSNSYPYSTPLIPIDSDARGHYHYAVAIWDGTNLWMDSGCPDIICN